MAALPAIPRPGDRYTRIKNYPLPSTGEVWFNNIRLEDVNRDVGIAQVYSGQASFADIFDVNVSLSKRGADFRGLRERTGSGRELLNFQNRMSTELSRVVPTLGLIIPVAYTC